MGNLGKKPLPPFGRKLYEASLKCTKHRGEIFLLYGSNSIWRRAKYYHEYLGNFYVLVLPDNARPEAFNWGIVNGFEVLCFVTSNIAYNLVRRLAYELLVCKAIIVRFVMPTSNVVIFRQGGENAA